MSASDLGIGRPQALHFDADRGVLVVGGQGRDGEFIAQVGSDENLIRRTDLGRVTEKASESRPPRSALNPEDGLVYTLDGPSLTGVDGAGTLRVIADLESVPLMQPNAITFAPSSDPTDSADAYNLFVADGGKGTNTGSIVEVSLSAAVTLAAPVDTATLVRDTPTSAWNPGSPDPSGVAWVSGQDQLIVVDSEVEEKTGAGWHDVNLWRTTRTGAVVGTGTLWGRYAALGGYSKEPTGAGYDPIGDTLFVSDDSASKVWVIKRGVDNDFGTGDDIVTSIDAASYGSTDTEDPDFETTTGDMFFLDGVGREIYRINPVDGIFGNGNDTTTHFDISHLGPADFEGLASAPGKGTLYVGARTKKQIFEISLTGSLIRTISLSGISGLRYISGLAVAPASTGGSSMSLYVVDRAIDNYPDTTENDGRLFEVTAHDIGATPTNQAPVAGDDSASTNEDAAVDIDVLSNDNDPDGQPLTVQIASQPANSSVSVKADQTVRFTPAADWFGTTSFTYRASDGLATSNLATVTVTVDPVNDAPVAVDDTATTATDTAVVVNVLANDIDVDGPTLAVTDVTSPTVGTVQVVTGGVRYTPPTGYVGQTTFTYRATDGSLVSNVATVTVTVRDPATKFFATGESTVKGTKTLDYTATYSDDNVTERLREELYSGNKRSRLEHRWSFSVSSGSTMNFTIRAHTSAEPFEIAYSTNGGSSWTSLTTIAATSETGVTVSVPASLSGSVLVRATDTVSSRGDSFADTLFVDEMWFRSTA